MRPTRATVEAGEKRWINKRRLPKDTAISRELLTSARTTELRQVDNPVRWTFIVLISHCTPSNNNYTGGFPHRIRFQTKSASGVGNSRLLIISRTRWWICSLSLNRSISIRLGARLEAGDLRCTGLPAAVQFERISPI